MGMRLILLASLLLLPPGRGFAADISFTGSLERVGDQSISIKLPDRRVIDAMLPNSSSLDAPAIAAQYSMGDEMEVRCKPIRPVWEAATSRFQSLEVTAIRFVRRPSAAEVLSLLEAKPREGEEPAAAPTGTPSRAEPRRRFGYPRQQGVGTCAPDQSGICGEYAQFRGRRNCETL